MAVYDVNGNELATSQASAVVVPEGGILTTCALLYAKYDALVSAGFATRTQIATVNSLPMYKYDFSAVNKWATGGSNAEDTSGTRLYDKKQILCFSGIHGDEKGSPLYLSEFMQKVCYDPVLSRMLALFDIHVVPIGNPYGYNANTRTNADGIDINRLDQSSGTVEAQALMSVIDSQAYDLFIDFHNTDSDQSTKVVGVTGAFSFANEMPEEAQVNGWETYLKASMAVERSLHEYWDMADNNGIQHFLPWEGTDRQTFRRYGYTHEVNGATVGAPVSACFEVSRYCYSWSGTNSEWNDKALIIGNSLLHSVFPAFCDKIVD